MTSNQTVMISLEELVSKDHQYRKLKELFDFTIIKQELKKKEGSVANF